MSEKQPSRLNGAPVGGIILLFLGLVLLLQTLNVLPWGLWGTLWQFWPVLIIISGLCILLRHRNAWLVSLLVLALLGGCLGISIWQYPNSSLQGLTTRTYTEPLNGLIKADVQVNFVAGKLDVGSLPADSTDLVKANYDLRFGESSLKSSFTKIGDGGRLSLETQRPSPRFWNKDTVTWASDFTTAIPLSLNINTDAGNIDVDMKDLKVPDFRLEADASNVKVTMPSAAGTTTARIKTNASNTEITIPAGVAASIKTDGALTALGIDTNRFPLKGGYYLSPDYDSAVSRINLEIESNLGRVSIK